MLSSHQGKLRLSTSRLSRTKTPRHKITLKASLEPGLMNPCQASGLKVLHVKDEVVSSFSDPSSSSFHASSACEPSIAWKSLFRAAPQVSKLPEDESLTATPARGMTIWSRSAAYSHTIIPQRRKQQ